MRPDLTLLGPGTDLWLYLRPVLDVLLLPFPLKKAVFHLEPAPQTLDEYITHVIDVLMPNTS